MNARRMVAAIVVLAFSFAPFDTAHADQAKATAIVELLDRRARAVVVKDEQAFLNTIDPQAAATFKQAQQSLFRGLTSLPLVDYTLTTSEVDSGDLAQGLDVKNKRAASNAYLPETQEWFRLGNYDDRPARSIYWYSYVERNGEWFVAADNDAGVIGLESAANLWDAGAVAATASDHFLTVTSSDQAARGSTLAAIGETAMTRFQSQWTSPWSGKIPLLVPPTPKDAARLLNTSADVAGFSAFTSYTPIRENGWSVTPPRLFAQDANLAGASNTSQVGTIVHELTHAAAASASGPFTPTWLQEGLAEWIRLEKPTSFALRDAVERKLPGTDSFVASGRAQLSAAYDAATSAVAFLSSIRGNDAPIRLFEEVGKRRVVAGSPSYNVDQAMRTVTGLSIAEFERQWRAVR